MMMMMMMIRDSPRSNPTVQIPTTYDFHPDIINSPDATFAAALHRYLPSNQDDVEDEDGGSEDFDVPVDAFSCDNFRMFEFKVKKCARARSHDWTDCPFAHPGEKARRRDPRKYHYSGNPCPDFRKGGSCQRGDACEYAHGVFECWLHPARYRTQPCKDGTHCRRRVCFFAHTPDQLRLLPYTTTTTTTTTSRPSSPATDSPPLSPSLNRLTDSIRDLQMSKIKLGFGLGSPRARPSFMSPVTPTRSAGLNPLDTWEMRCEEEPALERVESGKTLRDKIYAKLGQENSLDRIGRFDPVPDFGWVSELVK